MLSVLNGCNSSSWTSNLKTFIFTIGDKVKKDLKVERRLEWQSKEEVIVWGQLRMSSTSFEV